jgi:hypothetical protein
MIAREARWHVGRAGERGVRASSLALLAAEIVEADGAHPLDGGMCAQLDLGGGGGFLVIRVPPSR